MLKFTHAQRIFLFGGNVKKSINYVKERFHRKYPGVRVTHSSAIFRLAKNMRSVGSFLDNKHTTQNAVLIEAG
jgi:hypothetical protein